MCDFRTALATPRRLASRVGQVGAEVTGSNTSAQVNAKLPVVSPYPLEALADALADRASRPLGFRREASASPTETKCTSQTVAQRIQFSPDALRAPRIVVALCLFQFRAQFGKSPPVFGAGA